MFRCSAKDSKVKATGGGRGRGSTSWWGTPRPRRDFDNFYFTGGQTKVQRVEGTRRITGRVRRGRTDNSFQQAAGPRAVMRAHSRAHTHIHTHDGMQKLAPPWRMDPQSPQTQPRHMPAKREQLRPLGPHRRHLVTRESPRCQATGCWVGPAGTPWSPVFSTGACHPHASQSPALPLPGLKQKSPDFSRTDSGSSPSSPPPCDQDPSQARRRRSLLHEDCTNPRTAERTEGRNRGPSATAQQGLGSWLKHPRREREARRQRPGSPNPHRGPTVDRPVPAPLEISFTRTIRQSHKCT